MPVRLRCVFYDPDAVDTASRLSERAREACERADLELVEVADAEAVVLAMRERMLDAEQCAAVGAALRDAPVGALWITSRDLDVRGENVRVAEGEELLYEAVITELAERR